jgi:hypothetical protein
MRPNGELMTWAFSALVAGAPVVFAVWVLLTTNDTIDPIDVRLVAGPWACLAMSALGLTLSGYRLLTNATAFPESVFSAMAAALAMCEVPFFAWSTFVVALGIPLAPA